MALVGPAHPATGGIVHHTTELAHRLAERADVDAVSWWTQFPLALYPGTPRVPWTEAEVPRFRGTRYPLAWYRPGTWRREGRRLRRHDVVVLVVANPLQALPYRRLLAAAGPGVRSVAVVHNVVPHEPRWWHRRLMRSVLGAVDRVVVHSDDLARAAGVAGARPGTVRVAALAPHLPLRPAAAPVAARPPTLLFFGTVRRYKGLDVLLRALAGVPDVRLVVAGEFWEPVDAHRRLVTSLGLTGRVDLRPGYVPADDLPELFASADAVVLPYRHASASQNVELAAAFGLPAVVSDVGTLAAQVRPGVDGLVVPPEDVEALGRALAAVADPRRLAVLSVGVAHRPPPASWDAYVSAVLEP